MANNHPNPIDNGSEDGPDMANYLTSAIMQLLPAVNESIAAHRADCPASGCHRTVAERRDCPTLGLAAAALDLIIRCWRQMGPKRDGPGIGPAPRDLRGAVESRRLTDSEAAALAEILGVLDIAAAQAKDADLSLPTLAGIAVAVVDCYRATVPDQAGTTR